MAQEEKKELLLKDFCSRFPYGVKFNYGGYNGCDYKVELITSTTINNFPIEDCKPYLRTMSSMTEEEKKKYYETKDKYTHRLYPNSFDFSEHTEYSWTIRTFDYLNSIHVDYRGLISLGLAIEITPENDPYKILIKG